MHKHYCESLVGRKENNNMNVDKHYFTSYKGINLVKTEYLSTLFFGDCSIQLLVSIVVQQIWMGCF